MIGPLKYTSFVGIVNRLIDFMPKRATIQEKYNCDMMHLLNGNIIVSLSRERFESFLKKCA